MEVPGSLFVRLARASPTRVAVAVVPMGPDPRAGRLQVEAAPLPLRADGRQLAELPEHPHRRQRRGRQAQGRRRGAPHLQRRGTLILRQARQVHHPPGRGEQDTRV